MSRGGITKKELQIVIEASNKNFYQKVDKSIKELDQKIDSVKKDVKEMKKDISELKENQQMILLATKDFAEDVDKRFNNLETKFVTKDYLDEKLGLEFGKISKIQKNQNKKTNKLTKQLAKNNCLTKNQENKILQIDPFK